MEKLHTSKAFLKMAGGRMHIPHPTLLYKLEQLLFIVSSRNHQKNLAYFSSLAPLILFFLTKRQSQKGGPWPNVS